MAYEITRRKIAADRRRLAKRWAMIAVAGAAGLALGLVANDTRTVFGILAASTIATGFAFGVFLMTA
jgi:hypothetical protein